MPFPISIPRVRADPLTFVLDEGESAFILGANGVGKSSIVHHIYRAHHRAARRISAHRQTWFLSNAVTLSPHQKRHYETQFQAIDNSPQARWSDQQSTHRPSISIYDLIDAENVRARSIAAAVDSGDVSLAQRLARADAPIALINELLQLCNIPIAISIQANEEVVASKRGGPLYSIAELSDGERNALLLAGDTLTSSPGTLILIDEPERHLHRSIASPLLTLLFRQRPDCSFVISTHDVFLARDSAPAHTLLVRSCAYDGQQVSGWDVDLLSDDADISEDVKQDILGARRRILFVEGTDRSLDAPLYSLIFPDVSVVAKSNCREVERAVNGIRASQDLHWLEAYGIIDEDGRTPEEIEELRARGIHALPFYSVESIYYEPEIQRRVAIECAKLVDSAPDTLVEEAQDAALSAVSPHGARLSARLAERRAQRLFMAHAPTWKAILAGEKIQVELETAQLLANERTQLETAIARQDLAFVIGRYPVRETPALEKIASALGFKSRAQYEGSVRKLLRTDPEALEYTRSLFVSLTAELSR
jgi:ABC-type lipoprotein export system ATPase subunit